MPRDPRSAQAAQVRGDPGRFSRPARRASRRSARGAIDGFATDKLVLLALAQAANLRDFTLLPDDLSFEPFGIMLPRGDWAFRLAVNTGLARVFRSGEIIEIYTKYFSTLAPRPVGLDRRGLHVRRPAE